MMKSAPSSTLAAASTSAGERGGCGPVAHPRHHRHLRAAQPRRHRLVRAFAAESQAELAPEDGLARTRKLVRIRHQIDIRAADDRNPRLKFHSIASLPKVQS